MSLDKALHKILEQAVDKFKSLQFYRQILLQAENEDKTDLNYWMHYVNLFGVENKIPVYDKMHWFSYYNLDLVCLWLASFFMFFKVLQIIGCVRKEDSSHCHEPEKVKVD